MLVDNVKCIKCQMTTIRFDQRVSTLYMEQVFSYACNSSEAAALLRIAPWSYNLPPLVDFTTSNKQDKWLKGHFSGNLGWWHESSGWFSWKTEFLEIERFPPYTIQLGETPPPTKFKHRAYLLHWVDFMADWLLDHIHDNPNHFPEHYILHLVMMMFAFSQTELPGPLYVKPWVLYIVPTNGPYNSLMWEIACAVDTHYQEDIWTEQP